jgi:hypothetical protein
MRLAVAALALACLTAAVAVVTRADPPADAPPAPPAPAHPLLDQLNHETQDLYHGLRGSILRVQMPPPRWMSDPAARDGHWDRYKNLTPEVRRQLEQKQQRYADPANAIPTTQPLAAGPAAGPATQTVTDAVNDYAAQGVVIVVPPPAPATTAAQQASPVAPAAPAAVPAGTPPFAPNNIGLVLDDHGHVLVPVYVERESLADQPIRLVAPGGQVLEAKFVGSDQLTNLTVLQLPEPPKSPAEPRGDKRADGDERVADGDKPAAAEKPSETSAEKPAIKPVRLARTKPADGALVLYVSPNDAAGRLGVWSDNGRDYGVVVGVDGQVLGIARYGQFLGGSACQLIADQIVRHGAVRRATLGAIITQIEKDDPRRARVPALGYRPAVVVDQVMKGSAADRGGLRPGDMVLALADEPVGDVPAVSAAIAARNGRTPLRVLRAGEVIDVVVDLEQK